MAIIAILWPTVMTTFDLLLFVVLVYGFNIGAIDSLTAPIIREHFRHVNPAPLLGWYYTTAAIPRM